jgi:uncharacterized membrane protein YdjX (TVP38/TMEM64 family)
MRVLRTASIWVVVGALVVGYFLAQGVHSLGGPEGVRDRFGVVAPLVTGSLQLVLTPTPFPSDVICVAHGTLYGFWLAVPLNWFAWWLAALFEYAVGRRARRDFELDRHVGRLPAWLRRFPVEHPAFLILGRQVPWAGGHVTTLIPGALGVPFGRLAWCSAVSILSGAVLFAAVGAGLLHL